jgi:hypothetical protein
MKYIYPTVNLNFDRFPSIHIFPQSPTFIFISNFLADSFSFIYIVSSL